MSTATNVQEHFSLMGELLDPELPEDDQIKELLRHAEKELNLAVKLQARWAFQYAGQSVKRAHLLNDLCTGMLSAYSRLTTKWEFEDRDQEFSATEHAEYLALLMTALLPPLYKVEGRH
jgi:hypothetical protein